MISPKELEKITATRVPETTPEDDRNTNGQLEMLVHLGVISPKGSEKMNAAGVPETTRENDRNTNGQLKLIPGANAVAGGNNSNRTHTEQVSEVPSPSSSSMVDEELVQRDVIEGATLVVEDMEDVEAGSDHKSVKEVLDVKALPENPPKKRCRYYFAVVILAVIAGLAIIIGVVVQDRNQASANTANNDREVPEETEREVIVFLPFRDDLSSATKAAIQENPWGSQYKANAWIWNDPRLQEDSDERQMQRFAQANVYYATDGDNWFRNDDWLSYQVSECD